MANKNYNQPYYTILVNDQDITNKITSRLISINVTDNTGVERDKLEIVLDDAHPENDKELYLRLPQEGDEIQLWMGYEDEWNAVYNTTQTKDIQFNLDEFNKKYTYSKIGTFYCDGWKVSGPNPNTLTIIARTISNNNKMKSPRTYQWELGITRDSAGIIMTNITLYDVINTIITRNKNSGGVKSDGSAKEIPIKLDMKKETEDFFKNISITSLTQLNTSDQIFLANLFRYYGYNMNTQNVKDEKTKKEITVIKVAEDGKFYDLSTNGSAYGGIDFNKISVSEKDLVSWDFTRNLKSNFKGVLVNWWCRKTGKSGRYLAYDRTRIVDTSSTKGATVKLPSGVLKIVEKASKKGVAKEVSSPGTLNDLEINTKLSEKDFSYYQVAEIQQGETEADAQSAARYMATTLFKDFLLETEICTLSLQGNSRLRSDRLISLEGYFKNRGVRTLWKIQRVIHKLDKKSGYICDVFCEVTNQNDYDKFFNQDARIRASQKDPSTGYYNTNFEITPTPK